MWERILRFLEHREALLTLAHVANCQGPVIVNSTMQYPWATPEDKWGSHDYPIDHTPQHSPNVQPNILGKNPNSLSRHRVNITRASLAPPVLKM